MAYNCRTNVYLSVPISDEDLFDTVIKRQIICAHPEAKGNNFCPVCGLDIESRVKSIEVKRLKPHLQQYVGRYDPAILRHSVQNLSEYDVKFGIYRVFPLVASSEDESFDFMFGIKIISLEEGVRAQHTMHDLDRMASSLQEFLVDMGLKKDPPKMFFVNYVSC